MKESSWVERQITLLITNGFPDHWAGLKIPKLIKLHLICNKPHCYHLRHRFCASVCVGSISPHRLSHCCPYGPALIGYIAQVSLLRDTLCWTPIAPDLMTVTGEGMRIQQKQRNEVQLCCKLHFSSLCTVAACYLPRHGSASWGCKHLCKNRLRKDLKGDCLLTRDMALMSRKAVKEMSEGLSPHPA